MFSWALLALLLATTGFCSSISPGVKVRVTKKGVDYANQVAHDEIVQQLRTLSIPDQSGKDGHIEYSLTNIQVKGVTPPGSSISLVPTQNGLTWALSNFGISLNANWRVKYKKGIIKISDSGTVDVSLAGIDVSETAGFGIDGTGRPSISSKGCSNSIRSVNVRFHGGAAFILNLFRHTVERKVRDALQSKICQVVEQVVNGKGEAALANMPITVPIAKKFLLDYRLTAAPVVTADYLEIWDKGEVFWLAKKTECPFIPQTIPEYKNNNRMAYIWVTAYTPNTFLYQAHTNSFLQYNVTKKDLPSEYQSYLNTTCTLKCIGTLIPQMGKKCPNSSVELHLKTTTPPKTSASTEAVNTKFTGTVDFWARTSDNKEVYLLTLGVNVSLTLNASIHEEKLSGKILNHSLQLMVLKSDIGFVSSAVLNFVFDGILNIAVIPEINKITTKGIVLPMVQGLQFTNTELIMEEGNILIGTDLQFKVKDLRFKSEKNM